MIYPDCTYSYTISVQAPKKDKKDEDEEDKAFKARQKAEAAALKEAQAKGTFPKSIAA